MAGFLTRVKAATASFRSGSQVIADNRPMSETDVGAPQNAHTFTPITSPGALTRRRNLPTITQDEQLELAHHFLKSNPMASTMIEIPVQYSIGDGIQFTALSQNVKRILDKHWDNPTNNWSINQKDRPIDLGLTGEQIIPVYVNSQDGSVELGYIDPALVQTVIVDPENGMKNYAVLLRHIRGDDTTVNRAYKIIQQRSVSEDSPIFGHLSGLAKDKDQADKWGITEYMGKKERLKAPNSLGLSTNPQIVWAGSCFFFKVNSPLSATRGWSDLLAEMDWMDAHDQYLFATVEKAINAGRYVVDVLLKGFTEKQQRDWLAKNKRSFSPGDWWTRNENVEIKFPSPDLKLEDATLLAQEIKDFILAGTGLAGFWFGSSGTSRATAPEMTDAAFKSIRDRQRVIAYMISQIFRFTIDQARLAGMPLQDGRTTPGSEKDTESRSFYLRMPDVSAKDQRALSIAVRNISGAISTAVKDEFMSKEDAISVWSRYLELLGIDTWKMEPTSFEVTANPDFNIGRLFKASANLDDDLNSGETQREITHQGSTYYMFGDISEDYSKIVETIRGKSILSAPSQNGKATVSVGVN